MAKRKDPKQLKKLLAYVLGQRPDEFGLVPDPGGFVRLKDLIRAISEEPGWGYVRKSHIDEVLVTLRDDTFVTEADRIRIGNPPEGVRPVSGILPPKILYHCVRRKAYAVVCEKGIFPMGHPQVHLALTEALALRMGRRRDSEPVLLTVQARRASEAGLEFARQGELIYLVEGVPPDYVSGPPLPKEKRERAKPKESPPPLPSVRPGSFILDMERSDHLHQQKIKRRGGRKDIAWKRDARKLRRQRRQGS